MVQTFQSEGHILRRLKSLLRILLQTVHHDALERGIDLAVRLRQLRRVFLQNRIERFNRRLATKSTLTGKHLVKNRAQRENVRTMIQSLRSDLFRRHVSDRAHYHARICITLECWQVCTNLASVSRVDQLRKTEV